MADTEDISGSSSIDPTKEIKSGEDRENTPTKSFDSYMQPNQTPTPAGKESSGVATPFELAGQGKSLPSGYPTMDSLLGQMNSTSSVLGDVQSQLHTKNLKLKQSQKYILRNKLNNANENIRRAAEKTGAQLNPPIQSAAKQNPIDKFLGLVGDSQNQLKGAQTMIKNLHHNGKMLSPGDLLLIQIKIAKAQQELEYSSVLLSKAVDDVKQMFNIQI